MKSQLNWQAYQKLEFPSRSKRQPSPWSKLNDVWQVVLTYFSASSEPKVWQSEDASGLSQWKAYDPVTGESAVYDSETEMRVWLEERHYQYHRFTR